MPEGSPDGRRLIPRFTPAQHMYQRQSKPALDKSNTTSKEEASEKEEAGTKSMTVPKHGEQPRPNLTSIGSKKTNDRGATIVKKPMLRSVPAPSTYRWPSKPVESPSRAKVGEKNEPNRPLSGSAPLSSSVLQRQSTHGTSQSNVKLGEKKDSKLSRFASVPESSCTYPRLPKPIPSNSNVKATTNSTPKRTLSRPVLPSVPPSNHMTNRKSEGNIRKSKLTSKSEQTALRSKLRPPAIPGSGERLSNLKAKIKADRAKKMKYAAAIKGTKSVPNSGEANRFPRDREEPRGRLLSSRSQESDMGRRVGENAPKSIEEPPRRVSARPASLRTPRVPPRKETTNKINNSSVSPESLFGPYSRHTARKAQHRKAQPTLQTSKGYQALGSSSRANSGAVRPPVTNPTPGIGVRPGAVKPPVTEQRSGIRVRAGAVKPPATEPRPGIRLRAGSVKHPATGQSPGIRVSAGKKSSPAKQKSEESSSSSDSSGSEDSDSSSEDSDSSSEDSDSGSDSEDSDSDSNGSGSSVSYTSDSTESGNSSGEEADTPKEDSEVKGRATLADSATEPDRRVAKSTAPEASSAESSRNITAHASAPMLHTFSGMKRGSLGKGKTKEGVHEKSHGAPPIKKQRSETERIDSEKFFSLSYADQLAALGQDVSAGGCRLKENPSPCGRED